MKWNQLPSNNFERDLLYLICHTKIDETNYKKYWKLMNLNIEPSNIISDTNNIISDPNNSISYPKVWNKIKSLATILKETCDTWLVTPKLMKPATRSTEISWNLNIEPINIISYPINIISYPNNSISDPKVWNEIKSPAAILKETRVTCFFTPKLIRTDTSSTKIYWILEPSNIR